MKGQNFPCVILCKCAVVAVLRDVEKEVNCNKGAVVGQIMKNSVSIF